VDSSHLYKGDGRHDDDKGADSANQSAPPPRIPST